MKLTSFEINKQLRSKLIMVLIVFSSNLNCKRQKKNSVPLLHWLRPSYSLL